jgi:hypothetical protein
LALDELVKQVQAKLALVLDDAGLLWCWSQPFQPLQDQRSQVALISDAFHATEVAKLERPLRRGGRISIVRRVDADNPRATRMGYIVGVMGGRVDEPFKQSRWGWGAYIAESFSSYYVLAVWFDERTEVGPQQPLIRAAVPRIARLTGALPPPDGPTRTAGAKRARVPSR